MLSPADRSWLLRLRRGTLVAGLLAASVAAAQPVLHEPVSAPSLRCQDGVCQRDGDRDASLPEAVVAEDGMIGAPLGGRSPQNQEQVYTSANQSSPLTAELMRGAPPPGHDPPPFRRPRVLPDSDTGPEAAGERVYHEVFNPAVFPYKRMTTLDAVDESGALTVADQRQRELAPRGNRLLAGRDPFYGSLVVDFIANELVALPTPAAGIRLLSYQTTPDLSLSFSTDGADNLYARATRSGRHRLVYLVDAEQRYFAGPLFPPALRRRPLRLDVLPSPPALPRWLRRDAEKVLRHIGLRVSPSADYSAVLARLVGYFRDFQIAELPPDGEEGQSSLYLRIALSQRGVCRHRAYAFLITALAAGIPTRYVENELHVFVEVYVPAIGAETGYWRRINLGGAPLEQRVMGGDNRVAYQEKGGDPFERPPSFSHGAPPKVSGLPRRPAPPRDAAGAGGGGLPALDGPEDRARRGSSTQPPKEATAAPGSGGPGSGGPGQGSQGGGPQQSGTGPDSAGSGASGPGGRRTGEGGEGGEGEPGGRPTRDRIDQPDDSRSVASSELIPTRVTVAIGTGRQIYRGTAIPVRGQVTPGRGSAGGLEVYLLLAVPGHALPLGRTVTRSDGTFETEVEIPGAAPLGNFQIVARVRGDETRRGSSSGRYDRLGRAPGAAGDFVEND